MNPYIKLPKVQLIYRRHEFLIDIAKGKRVLHLGCTDAGLLDKRFERGELLHQRLDNVAEALWGFDIDREGIEFLQANGFENCIVGDVAYIDQHDQLRDTEFDLILASEVVEHLQNPGLFFQAIKKLMKPNHTEIVVTVPNAFRIETLLWLFRGIEYVHPDHNYWFSYLTITNLLQKNGFIIDKILTYTFQKHHLIPDSIRRRFNKNEPQVQENLNLESNSVHNADARQTSRGASVISYLRQLPKRVLAAYLFRKTPFWADGVIVIAKVDEASDL